MKPFDFRYRQDDLETLCRDRSASATEPAEQNHLYGMDAIIREYADLPGEEPLPWAMEHFISFESPDPDPRDLNTGTPIVLAVSEAQAEALRRCGRNEVYAIGSIYHYARRLYERHHPSVRSAPARKGTLVFPDKSTIAKDTDFDRRRFAEQLAALPAEFQPVAVSIFWKDYLRGTHRPFAEAGLRLVTSGHTFDPEFLYRQHDLCRQFKYACANDISTSFCLSVLSGCRFFHLPSGPLTITECGRTETYDREPTLDLPGKQLCLSEAPFPPRGDGREQSRLAERFSGLASFRAPGFFRELFKEGHRQLRGRPRTGVDFASANCEASVRAQWGFAGIQADGWAGSRCSWSIPKTGSGGLIRARMEVPDFVPGANTGTMELIVTYGGRRRVLPCHSGYWTLSFPAASNGDDDRFVLTSSSSAEIPNDHRRVSFRLLEISWEPQSDNDVRKLEFRRDEMQMNTKAA